MANPYAEFVGEEAPSSNPYSSFVVSDNPYSHLVDESPSTPETDKALSSLIPRDIVESSHPEQYFDSSQHPIAENAAAGAISTLSGFVPRTLGAAAELATPAATGIKNIGRGIGTIQDWVAGEPFDQIAKERFPESQILAEADKTPPFSKERFEAGFNVLAQMGMAAGVVHGTTRSVAKPAVGEPEPIKTSPSVTVDEGTAIVGGDLNAKGIYENAGQVPSQGNVQEAGSGQSSPNLEQQAQREAIGGERPLEQAATQSQTSDEFIKTIQEQPELLDEIYKWEQSTPENQARFKNTGWFGIATDYFNKSKAKSVPSVEQSPVESGLQPEAQISEPIGVADAIAEIQRRNAPTERNPETTAPLPTEETGTTGISQRMYDERAVQEPIQPGEGISAEEQVKRGQLLVESGANPDVILQQMKETGHLSGDAISILRAKHEELSRVTNRAEDELVQRPNDPQTRANYDQAWQFEKAWAQEIKPFQTEWHKIGQSMQGEVDVDTGSFTGLRRAIVESRGTDLKPTEVRQVRDMADKVRKADQSLTESKLKYDEAIKRNSKGQARTAEQLREHFAERIRQLTPC